MITLNLRLRKNTEQQAPLNVPIIIWQPAIEPVNVCHLFGRVPRHFMTFSVVGGYNVPIEEANQIHYIEVGETNPDLAWHIPVAEFAAKQFLWSPLPSTALSEMMDYLKIVKDSPKPAQEAEDEENEEDDEW